MFWECCGYPINRPPTQLKEKEFDRFHACVSFVENGLKLMDIENDPKYAIPHSTLDWWIHEHLKDLSPELYSKVCLQFRKNMSNRRNHKNGSNQ